MRVGGEVPRGGPSRRQLLSLVAILGLAGCSDWQASQDKYIQQMKQDPMFTWAPSGNLRRDVSYSLIGTGFEPSGVSTIDITYALPQPGDVSELLAAGQRAMSDNGFDRGLKRIDPKYQMQCEVYSQGGDAGIHVVLTSPIWT
jgi:hypothetical protein